MSGQKGNSSSAELLTIGGGGTATPASKGEAAGAAGWAAGVCAISAFHARMSVYQRPLYSRLSMSKLTVAVWPTLSTILSALSPKQVKCTLRGYVSCVSSTYSFFFHALPERETPYTSGRAAMILPVISIFIFMFLVIFRFLYNCPTKVSKKSVAATKKVRPAAIWPRQVALCI